LGPQREGAGSPLLCGAQAAAISIPSEAESLMASHELSASRRMSLGGKFDSAGLDGGEEGRNRSARTYVGIGAVATL
jgi:hypothetical protein